MRWVWGDHSPTQAAITRTLVSSRVSDVSFPLISGAPHPFVINIEIQFQ